MTAFASDQMRAETTEEALLEILRQVADLQTTTATNPQNRTVITQFSQNELTGIFTVALTIPSKVSYTDTGLVAKASEVFV